MTAGATDVALTVDVLVTWIGAATLARYVATVRSRGERSALESRARFLIGVLAAMLFVRGFSWIMPGSKTLAVLTFVPVAILPVATTVFVEGLLRRHMPRWMKVFAVIATVAALISNLIRLGTTDSATLRILGFVALGGVSLTLVFLAVLIARRNPTDLSRAENALVRVALIVALVAVPLIVTDFRFAIGWPPVRFGTIGVLLFCHSLLSTAGVWRWLADVGRLVARSALVGIFIAIALQTWDSDLVLPMTVLALAIMLASAIFDRIRDLMRSSPQTELLRWLGRPATTSPEDFAREVRHLRLTADSVVLDERQLSQYDPASIVEAFPNKTVVQSLTRLRSLAASVSQAPRGVDELIDLLERHGGSTHVCLVTAQPLRLLVTVSPDLAGTDDVALSLAAVVRHVSFADGRRG